TPPPQRFIGRIGRPGQRKFRQVSRRHGEAHDFKSERRKWHADKYFGHTDAATLPRHDPTIRATGEYTAARNGMTIDCGHHWLRVEEHCLVKAMKSGQKLTNIIGTASAQSLEVDASGENPALTGQHHSPGIRRAQFGKIPRQHIAEFDVERTSLAMGERQDSNAICNFALYHAPCSAGLARCA